jgi:RND family efflux transporter MFP subunit
MSSIAEINTARLLRIGAVVFVSVAVLGTVYRVTERRALAAETLAEALPLVELIVPSKGAKTEGLELPATLQAYAEAPIYARTSGYLKSWKVDIGAKVAKNEVLAEIDAPDLDQQVAQAQADFDTATANAEIAEATNRRWQQLLVSEAVSPQDAEEKAADARAKAALMRSARANLARLKDLVSFKRIVAPFAGTVTARNTDVGALINAGQNSGDALFRVADTHVLRAYVNVPADSAARIHLKQKAKLTVAGMAHVTFEAQVTSFSQALDSSTRTMQVQLEVNNADGKILVGSFANVHFDIEGRDTLKIPATALIFRSQGLMVASVNESNVVRLKPVTVARDLGTEVEILNGLDGQEKIVANPPDSLITGSKVRVLPPKSRPSHE